MTVARGAVRAQPKGGLTRALGTVVSPAHIALAVIVLAGLALRLRNIDHGLPHVFHPDEAYHYTSRALAMFGGDLNPRYFQNPSGFTYLVYAVLRLQHGGWWPFGGMEDVVLRYRADPAAAFETARSVAAVLCMLGVAGVFAVGKRLWGAAEGLAAAAVLGFAFLPVAYSRFAVPDVGVLLPVSVALYAAVRVYEEGRLRHFLLAGAAIGLGVGFKYTAGALVAPLIAATALRGRPDRATIKHLAISLGVATLVFLATTPYFLLDLQRALYQLKVQFLGTGTRKLGQASDSALGFYLRSLTWGLGWGAAIAAGVGLLWELRRDRVRALLLALFPLVVVLYLAGGSRFFARWLLPAYPVLALLAGVALARAARLVSARPGLRAAALAGLVLAVVAQPLAAGVRTAELLGREDTRELAREFMARHLAPGTRVVVEPAVPTGFFGDRYAIGFGPPPKTPTFLAAAPRRFVSTLRPERIDRYRAAGYCVVVSMSLIRDRAVAGGRPDAVAYYRRLDRESRPIFKASPYHPGARPVRYDPDISTHLYYPPAYRRPGPEVTIHRLDGCRQADGTWARSPAGA